jgi:hypothetical protein
MAVILYDSNQVRSAILRLMAAKGRRRIAISAFVGQGVHTYLRNPKGLQLICWPNPGGTNPHMLRQLMKRGAKVSFVGSLHMKLYWAEGLGAVVTSANLSTNALGAGGLKEVGVLLSDSSIDIDRILSSLKMRRPSEKELDRLDKEHDRFQVRNPNRTRRTVASSFSHWYNSQLPRKWKLGWYDADGTWSRAAVEIAKRDYGIHPFDFISCKRADFSQDEWVLTFMVNKGKITDVGWLFVDYVTRVPQNDKKAYDATYPYSAVQVGKPRGYPPPPFRIDSRLRASLKRAVFHLWPGDSIKDIRDLRPPKPFLKLVLKHYLHP